MAQWDGTDANRAIQIGLINSSPSLGAVLHHRASLAGSGSPCANRQQGSAPSSPLPRGTKGTDCSGWGKTWRFHLCYQQAVEIKDQSQQHRGSYEP